MKNSILLTAAVVAVAALSLASGASASEWVVRGVVYFAPEKGQETPCTDVALYDHPLCRTIDSLAGTITDCCGYFEFDGDWPDTVWVKMRFDVLRICADPYDQCGWNGTCSNATETKRYTSVDEFTLFFDLDQADCDRTGPPPLCP